MRHKRVEHVAYLHSELSFPIKVGDYCEQNSQNSRKKTLQSTTFVTGILWLFDEQLIKLWIQFWAVF